MNLVKNAGNNMFKNRDNKVGVAPLRERTIEASKITEVSEEATTFSASKTPHSTLVKIAPSDGSADAIMTAKCKRQHNINRRPVGYVYCRMISLAEVFS